MAWQSMDTAPRDRHILVRRDNGCQLEHAIVWRSTFEGSQYPWVTDHNAYPEGRFDEWHEIP